MGSLPKVSAVSTGPEMGVARLSAQFLALALLIGDTGAAKFKCPAFTKLTSDPFVFADPVQCDKYWTCVSGQSTRSLCPDGLVFHPDKEDGEDPCDLKANVPDKCEGRDALQRAKPGDSFCPRQYGVYPSTLPWECDTYYTCQNGKSSRTVCAEGLHYSDYVGICVWARDSGREDCAAQEEEKQQSKNKKTGGDKKPERKPAAKLSNGFVCPGGPEGVHPALPHPSDCRLYYVCLNGLEPSQAGCPPRKVFNPKSKKCDVPANVEECEDYYNPAAKAKKAEIASTLGTELDSDNFSMFLKLLKKSGVFKNNLLQGSGIGALGSGRSLAQGGRPGGRPGKRPRRPGRPGRPGRVGRPGRPGGRPQRPLRPLRVTQPSYDYYEYDIYDSYDYKDPETVEKPGPNTAEQFRDPVDTIRVTPTKQNLQKSVEGPVTRKDLLATPASRKGLFSIPANRKNKFTSRYTPKVKPVGNTENLAPVPSLALDDAPESVALPSRPLQPIRSQGPVQPVKSAISSLSASEADNLFQSLFPGLGNTETPEVVHPGLPEPVILAVIKEQPKVQPKPEFIVAKDDFTPRSRNSLFSKRHKMRPITSMKETEEKSVDVKVTTENTVTVKSEVNDRFSTRPRTSFFSNRRNNGRKTIVETETSVDKIPVTTTLKPVIEEVNDAPRQSSIFQPRRRLRTSLKTTVTEETTESIQIDSSPSFAPSNRHRFPTATLPTTFLVDEVTSSVQASTSPSFSTRRKSFQGLLTSRSNLSNGVVRQKQSMAPRQPKPAPEISPANSPNTGGSQLAPTTPIPVSSAPQIEVTHNSQSFTPRRSSISRARTAVQHRQRPVLAHDLDRSKLVTTPISKSSSETIPLTRQRTSSSRQVLTAKRRTTTTPIQKLNSRQSTLLPAFLQQKPASGRALFISGQEEESLSQNRIQSNEVSSHFITPVIKHVLPERVFSQNISPRRGNVHDQESSSSSTSPQSVRVRVSSTVSEDSSATQHMLVMQARSQLKRFLPAAENEGDAVEKLRAKIESLKDTNRHRGRG